MEVKALDLFLKQKRFDLIFKYLYVKYRNNFTRRAYLENIRSFNGFYEVNPSDGIPKQSAEDFVLSFDELIKNLEDNNFTQTKGTIPIGSNGEITDGAHRLAACAYMNLTIDVCEDLEYINLYDYRFFRKMKMDEAIMDYGALEYVKLNPNAYIVNLHSVVDVANDDTVEAILNKYGCVFYKKSVDLTYNGYVNVKKISYGSFWERESWIGNSTNKFSGLQEHAQCSRGKFPLRAFVFICENLDYVVKAKQEIRELFNIGNFSVHINDTHDEAIWMAETYFNANSLSFINHRPFFLEDESFDVRIDNFKKYLSEVGVSIDDVCGAGSTPLNVFAIRKSDDFDYLSLNKKCNISDNIYSPHDDQLTNYPYSKQEIITNPQYHFYYHGLKFISLSVLYKFKEKRSERPKDLRDCRLIRKFYYKSFFDFSDAKRRMRETIQKTIVFHFILRCIRKIKRILRKLFFYNGK